MTKFDHAKLVRRDPVELARFRRWVLSGQAGDLEAVAVVHDRDGRCCKSEPWSQTAAVIIIALEPATPQVLLNLNQPPQ
jgi:hypothetical protein